MFTLMSEPLSAFNFSLRGAWIAHALKGTDYSVL